MSTSYRAGWNKPGSEPDVTPLEFADFRDAVAHLVRAVERFWDDDYYRYAMSDQRVDIDGTWLPVHSALAHASYGPTFRARTPDGRVEFWITPLD